MEEEDKADECLAVLKAQPDITVHESTLGALSRTSNVN